MILSPLGALRRLCLLSLLAPAAVAQAQAAALTPAPAPVQPHPEVLEHGVYIVHLLLHPIGREEYTLTASPDGLETLRTTLTSSDRGMPRTTTATVALGPTGQPLSFEQRTTTSAGETLATTAITPGSAGKTATITEPGLTRTIAVPPLAFVGTGAMPAAVEMELMRYWRSRHMPPRLPLLRASAEALPLEIHETGHDAFLAHGRMVRLTRYTVANLVFGREILWMNDSNRLAAVMTFAGGLPAEEILDEYEPVADQLFQSAVQQEMLDLAALTRAVPPEATGAYAIVGARLIDGLGGPPVPHATVVIRAGRIAAVTTGPAPAGMRVIHAEGRSLLPGLWEMHAHYSGVEFGPALLAAGITTARDCGGEFSFLIAVRHAIDTLHQLGPRLLLAGLIDSGGPLGFGSVLADTPADAVKAVDFYARSHFDQIKIYDQVQPDVLRAITAEAHHDGLTVTGHIPKAVSTEQAILDGMDMINHLQFVTNAMRPASAPGAPPGKDPIDVDSPTARQLIAFLKQHQTVVDPTVAWAEMAGHPKDLNPATFEPGLDHAPYTLAARFRAMGSPAEDAAKFNQRMSLNLAVIGSLYRAGVPIIPGSDTGLQGYGLIRELELYVQAGMTPMAAIQSATLVSARAMHRDADSGSIAPGKRADLILVQGDPSTHISDLRHITQVITAGTLYDCQRLHASIGFH